MLTVQRHILAYPHRRKNADGNIKVTLIQEQYPKQLVGRRAGEGLYVGKISIGDDSQESREFVRSMLEHIPGETDIAIISEHPGNLASLDLLQQQADEHKQLIVARLGYCLHEPADQINNSAALIIPGHQPIYIDQISFSAEDLTFQSESSLHHGNQIYVFSTPLANIGIISCHDYTHVDVLKQIFDHNIEILVISSFNPATRLFMQYALADIHRFSCFVIISNIANYGGSGVFAPFRYNGPRRASLSLGGALAYTQGQTQAYLEVDLPIADLRKLRNGQSSSVDSFEDAMAWIPIYPSEEFLSPDDTCLKTRLAAPDCLDTINLEKAGYRPAVSQDKMSIGVVQLPSMAAEDYLDNYYCISCSPNAPGFTAKIQSHLQFIARKLELTGEKLDFLVFPEVFLPLGLEDDLKAFAGRHNTIIIGGVEYDPQPDDLERPELAEGLNRCFIYVPTQNGDVKRYQYNKLTRSQYDALLPPGGNGTAGHFNMIRGDKLFRFTYGDKWAFGVLICYDYSHFDIVHRINRAEDHHMPPELLFVVANNPDSQLYERCCMADSHRYYQYIIMSNVSQYGGSGIFGPVKTQGRRQTLLNAGIGTEGIFIGKLDLRNLQELRNTRQISSHSNFQHKPGLFQTLK